MVSSCLMQFNRLKGLIFIIIQYEYISVITDESQKRITLLPEKFTELDKMAIKGLYKPDVLAELNHKEANELLVRSAPREVRRRVRYRFVVFSSLSFSSAVFFRQRINLFYFILGTKSHEASSAKSCSNVSNFFTYYNVRCS